MHGSHSIVCWTTTALWTHPVDVLAVVLDVAGLAVDAVGGVDDQLHVPRVVRLILVHSSWAEPVILINFLFHFNPALF